MGRGTQTLRKSRALTIVTLKQADGILLFNITRDEQHIDINVSVGRCQSFLNISESAEVIK